jgi:tRNA nucleotidyltransferase/poly(A) polymerase
MTRAASQRVAAVSIVRALRAAGHVAHLAGGCVRDALLGLAPKDCDVATDAPPQVVKELFRGSRLVGEAFGVVLVRRAGQSIEVATFRREWGYADGRRPTHVEFTDAVADAQRRDFTINGLFEDPLSKSVSVAPAACGVAGRVIDYVGGLADLRAGLIRAIGDPEARFGEDYLRMLRAVRFASALDFQIEPATAAAIRRHAPKLAQISRERIGAEVQKMFTPPAATPGRKLIWRPARAAELMQHLELDAPTLTEVHQDPGLPTIGHLGAADLGPAGYPAALAAWALDRGEGGKLLDKAQLQDLLLRWRSALCLSNDDRAAMAAILMLLPQAMHWATLTTAGRKRLLGHERWSAAWAVFRALGHRPDVAPVAAEIGAQSVRLFEQGVAPPALITGAELIALGLMPGPVFGRLLREAYDAQLNGEVTTPEQARAWLRRHAAEGKTRTR